MDIRGEVSGRLLDADGQPVPNPLDARVVGATLDQLRSARRIITTAAGANRQEATVAVARAGLIHTLIIDSTLAEAVVA
jgi:DNA-binding transcriptional regulator LsrR (DeoR family)